MSWGLRPRPEPREITREETEQFEQDRIVYAIACSLAAGRTGYSGEPPTQEDIDQAEALGVAAMRPSTSPSVSADEAPPSAAPSGS